VGGDLKEVKEGVELESELREDELKPEEEN